MLTIAVSPGRRVRNGRIDATSRVRNDKRCVMEALLAGLPSITVSAERSTLEQSLNAAADNLEKTLNRTFGRLNDPKGHVSYAGGVVIAGGGEVEQIASEIISNEIRTCLKSCVANG